MNYPILESVKEKYFVQLYERLYSEQSKKKISLTRTWANSNFPAEAGVYVFFENDKLIYVGETGNLLGRMRDMLNTLNHSLRRSLGEALFKEHPDYTKATSSKAYCLNLEKLLNKHIETRLTVSCLPLNLGRKEFEEWLQESQKEIKFLNKRKKRK